MTTYIYISYIISLSRVLFLRRDADVVIETGGLGVGGWERVVRVVSCFLLFSFLEEKTEKEERPPPVQSPETR